MLREICTLQTRWLKVASMPRGDNLSQSRLAPNSFAGGPLWSGPLRIGARWFWLAALLLGVAPVSFAQSVSISLYALPTHSSSPYGLTAGPDGAVWFAECNGNKIGRITTAGVITEYPLPEGGSCPTQITSGPDGAMWFVELESTRSGHQIGRITTSGVISEYSVPNTGFPVCCQVDGIAAGSDGALWFTAGSTYQIGRITTTGQFTMFSLPQGFLSPGSITAGPDGALWFTEGGAASAIGRITTAGAITSYPSSLGPEDIAAGPDGALWFTGSTTAGSSIGRVTTAGTVTAFPNVAEGVSFGITQGPDGALWFAETSALGRVTTGGTFTQYPCNGSIAPSKSSVCAPNEITLGPDGALWFSDIEYNFIGRASLVALSLASLSPASATAGGPAFTLTVNGSGFLSGAAVLWNGSPLSTSYVSGSQLNASVPASLIASQGSASVTVQNPGGATSNALTFTINAPTPSLSSLSPNSATAGGPAFTLTANGSGFLNGSNILWNGSALSTSYVSGNQLSASVPANLIAAQGSASITVQNPGGTTSNAVTFTINPAPVCQPVSVGFNTHESPAAFTNNVVLGFPSSGCAWVVGTNASWITFSSNSGTASGTSVTIPYSGAANSSSSPRIATISLTVNGSQVTSFVPYIYQNSNSCAYSIFPSNVTIPASGGSGSFTVTSSPGCWYVLFTGVPTWLSLSSGAVSYQLSTGTFSYSAAANAGGAQVAALTFGGLTSGGGATITITQAGLVSLSLSSLSPNSATAGGPAFTLTANGSGFLSGSSILWSGSPLSTSYISGNQLSASVSAALIASQGSAAVTVQNPGGTTSNALTFTINAPTPSLSSLSPSSATAGSPAFTLTVNGSGFLSGSTVLWNGSALSTSYVSGNQLSASVPASVITSQGSATVTVQNPSGPISNALTFTINAPTPSLATPWAERSSVSTANSFSASHTPLRPSPSPGTSARMSRSRRAACATRKALAAWP